MTNSLESWITDLKIAARFVRSVHTGRPRIDIELQYLADQIDYIAEQQTAAEFVDDRPKRDKPVDEAA